LIWHGLPRAKARCYSGKTGLSAASKARCYSGKTGLSAASEARCYSGETGLSAACEARCFSGRQMLDSVDWRDERTGKMNQQEMVLILFQVVVLALAFSVH
jgi:hypothetical protein